MDTLESHPDMQLLTAAHELGHAEVFDKEFRQVYDDPGLSAGFYRRRTKDTPEYHDEEAFVEKQARERLETALGRELDPAIKKNSLDYEQRALDKAAELRRQASGNGC